MQPKFDALYRAIVTSNVDNANTGKIKVQCPQISGIAEIRFAEPSNPQMPVPSTGTTVWIGFSGGDVTKPFYITNQASPLQVPSTGLPSSPYEGMLVWETDLNQLIVWNGASWNTVWPSDADAPWISYTPSWTGLSSLGTSQASGRYQVTGNTVNLIASLSAAGSTSLGTGAISVSLPITSHSVGANNGWMGTGRYVPAPGSSWHPLNFWVATAANIGTVFAIRQTDIAYVSPGTPGYTWAAGSIMNIQLTYEI